LLDNDGFDPDVEPIKRLDVRWQRGCTAAVGKYIVMVTTVDEHEGPPGDDDFPRRRSTKAPHPGG